MLPVGTKEGSLADYSLSSKDWFEWNTSCIVAEALRVQRVWIGALCNASSAFIDDRIW